MKTFFVHVHGPAYEAEGPEVWLGASLGEIYELDDLKRAIRPHAPLSVELATRLYGDRDEDR